MVLIKVRLWNIVARRGKAFMIIVLAMEPSLLYLVGQDPTDLVDVCQINFNVRHGSTN